MIARVAGIAAILQAATVCVLAAGQLQLAPFKDELFKYQKVISSTYGGDYQMVEYLRERDLYGRDEVVEMKAFPKHVFLGVDKVQRELSLSFGGRSIKYVGVGKTTGGAKPVVVFVHGLDGNRHQAFDDWTFGGNFNRLKNLVVANGGVYLSPDFSNFGAKGATEIAALIGEYSRNSPGAPVVVACTSNAGKLCFRLIANPKLSGVLGGIVLLGTGNEESFFASAAFKDAAKRVPIFIAHGQDDKVIPWVNQEVFFKKVKAAVPDYPIKMTLFVGGAHGTPMRMTDWRMTLNWMLAR
jgi:pimeloyl-ACP methyl ester carboxylesterase